MPVLFSSWLSELVLVLAGGLVVLYLWLSYCFTYWTKKGVPQLEPSFPFGNLRENALGRSCMGVVYKNCYDQLRGHRFGGIYGFGSPMLLVRDPDLIRYFLVKDFTTFMDRGLAQDTDKPITKHLFNMDGHPWKRLRVKLTPTFTTGKLKMMFSTINACGRELAEVLEDSAQCGEVLEMREITARYSTDIIASVAFGIECHCQRNPDAEFRQWGRQLFKPSFFAGLLFLMRATVPAIARLLPFPLDRSEVLNYFSKMVRDTIDYRETNNVSRKDFMELLIQLKNKGAIDGEKESPDSADRWKLSIDEVTAQCLVFFIAGFETTSTTVSFALLELSHNQDIQRKLHEEIDSVMKKHNGELSYESISEMSYLHKVVSETLRKYPPLPQLNRRCAEDYKVPDSNVVLEKGTKIVISVIGLHMDPEHFPDPDRFDPERFSEENNAKIHPFAYMPFGEGPRICIGMRLGLLQSKVAIAHMLSKYSVHPTEKTPRRVEFVPRSILLMSKTGIYLRLQKRK